ncbi:MAG: transposase [Candidatus Hadarchaeota archaeon]
MRKRKRYPRDEPLYNLIQENEVMLFFRYLPLAAWWVAGDKSLWTGMGRPPKNLYDIIVCLAVRKYFNFSLRRGMGLLRLFRALGVIDAKIPCFKTLDNYQRDRRIEPYLDELVKLVTDPLKCIEHFFATDTTGTATTCYSSWFDIRTRKEGNKRDHIMAHVTVGTRLKAAVALDARTDRGAHNEVLREHIKEVAKSFEVREWSADRAYLSRDNCNAVAAVGAEPWIKLKSNTTAKTKGSPPWRRMVQEFRRNPEVAERKYHRRSAVESAISAKKRKFGSFVRAREDASKENEETLSWLGYNFSVLCRGVHEFGLKPGFAS